MEIERACAFLYFFLFIFQADDIVNWLHQNEINNHYAFANWILLREKKRRYSDNWSKLAHKWMCPKEKADKHTRESVMWESAQLVNYDYT